MRKTIVNIVSPRTVKHFFELFVESFIAGFLGQALERFLHPGYFACCSASTKYKTSPMIVEERERVLNLVDIIY